MKFINRIFIVVALVIAASSCDVAELDLLDNPNAITADQASVNDLYNAVQLNFENFISANWFYTAGMSRMIAATGAYDYQNAYTPISFDNTWRQAYQSFIPDADAIIGLGEELGLDIHAGSAKIMKAYVLTALVDIFGDVPASNANRAEEGAEFFSPTSDPGAEVYAAANALLDDAIAQLEGTKAAAPAYDNFYGGNAARWVTTAKTLKLRNAVTARLADGTAASTINSLVAEGDLIDDSAEDFQFNYGTERNQPDSRHPLYGNSYEAADGNYMSNYYMWLLRAEKEDADGNPIIDPRIRFYFYRQVSNSFKDDVTLYSCHFSNFPDQEEKPVHWNDVDSRIPYCVAAEDGYWGRDHLNNEGIPPDGPERTVYGLYPVGGKFDDNSFEFTQQLGQFGEGAGQGIQPLWLSSFTDFVRAEAALTLGTNDDARALLESGIRKSMNKVTSFQSFLDAGTVVGTDIDGNSITLGQAYLDPLAEDIEEYVTFVMETYDAAGSDDERLNVLMKEYYIALWGNGREAYNMYRRTGKPDNMAPSLEPGPGPFIRSFFYPSEHVNLNQNASQKEITKQVFWDTNSPDFVY